jgi:hypothetical protein
VWYMDGKTGSFLAIQVIEPQDSARVQWDVRQRNEFTSLLPAYAELVMPVTDSTGAVWQGRLLNGFQYYATDTARRRTALARAPELARSDAARLWAFLDAHRNEGDRQRAMRTLRSDGFFANRMVAAMVLANFAANDSTWLVLARALRDPHEAVRGFAGVALKIFPPRKMDWSPATKDLRLLLGGTNLPGMRTVWDVLLKSDVSPDLAPALLHGNAQFLLQHLDSEAPGASSAAHALLVRFNRGTDLGPAAPAWSRWAAGL